MSEQLDSDKSIEEVLTTPGQRAPDEQRTLPEGSADRAFEEVLDQAANEDARKAGRGDWVLPADSS